MKKQILYILFLALLAVASRLIAPWPNFTAVIAVTFTGGLLFKERSLALLFPLLIVFFSDLVINNTLYATGSFTWFTSGAEWLYGAYLLVALLGVLNVNTNRYAHLAVGSVLGSLLFYLISNFGVWMSGILYTKDLSGLMVSYTAGLPFLFNQILGTAFYGLVIYGFYLASERKLELNPKKVV